MMTGKLCRRTCSGTFSESWICTAPICTTLGQDVAGDLADFFRLAQVIELRNGRED